MSLSILTTPSSRTSFWSTAATSLESQEKTEQTTIMMPIFFPESEDQRMRFRYALSQILLPPPAEYEEGDFGEEEELEGLEGSVDELPEIDVWERYRGPNAFDVETGLEDFGHNQDEEDEENLENEEDEGDEGEWQEEEEADE